MALMAYYSEAKSRITGTTIIVGRADALGLDEDGGAWVTICQDHGSICNHWTLALARAHAPGGEWCDDCRPRRYLTVRSYADPKYEHRIEITGKSERAIETVERGLLRQMNRSDYYVGPVIEERRAPDAR